MSLPEIGAFPLWINALAFAAAAVVVWFSGVRLERYADAISFRTGLSQAFVGALLVAVVTSLPEVAVAISGARIGSTALVTMNLTGATLTQMAVLAATGWFVRDRGTLTYLSPQFSLLITGVGLFIVQTIAIVGMAVGPLLPVRAAEAWSAVLAMAYVATIYFNYRIEDDPRWQPTTPLPPTDQPVRRQERCETCPELSTGKLYLFFWLAAGSIFIAGWVLSHTAEALAAQTGLGSGFIGATLLSITTSLPEISVTVAAVRSGAYPLAVGNILGTNAFNLSVLFVADLFYREGAILQDAGPAAIFATALAALMTGIFLWGLLGRVRRSVLGIGWDSATVLALYLFGIWVLYQIR